MKSHLVRVAFGVGLLALSTHAASAERAQPINAKSENQNSARAIVAHWMFDENGGSVLHDSSGYGNDGVIYGATWTNGVKGGALQFNGVDNYVLVGTGSNGSLDFWNGDFTVSAWEQMSDSGCVGDWSRRDIIGKGDPYNSGYAMSCMCGCFAGYVGNTSRLGATQRTPQMKISDGEWHNVVMTRRSGTVTLYVDGVSGFSYQWSGNVNTSDPLVIGRHPIKTETYFKGKIDEITIYNYSLSPLEVGQQFTRTAPNQ